ncbi:MULTISPECIES: hypothetical protein [unclassified Rhodococcus (in: high G+C Gram-positive bacteria)]|nr:MULTISPECIES: hypothetical protein [unclassified Rhodococcus (in: high G+C Gram-positive bacteria)]
MTSTQAAYIEAPSATYTVALHSALFCPLPVLRARPVGYMGVDELGSRYT